MRSSRGVAERGPGLDRAFGAVLRHFREAAGLSQQALAERARLSVRGIADLERGARRYPYPATIAQLADALDLSGPDRAALVAAGRRSSAHSETAASHVTGTALRRHNLPEHLPTLIGREEAMLDLRQLLAQTQTGLLTFTGPGGSGKTRLALAVATEALEWASFPHGVWLAELAPLTDPMLVAGVVAASVGVKEQLGKPILDTFVEEISSRSLLLVLDNCEHLIDASAALAQDLLRHCAGLRILATSREPLRITGERVWRVAPLRTPDAGVVVSAEELTMNPAVQLFVARAEAAEPTLSLTPDSITAIAEICTRLDGLPLAIELAAARTRVLTPVQILDRLHDAFRLLVGGSRTAPTRQQTLRAALDWSYLLLSPAEQQRFERLSVFAGGFDLDGVIALWSEDCGGSAAEALDMLTVLVDRSLVTPQPLPGRMRYRVLEPVRQYAQEKLTERGGWEAACEQHAEYYVRFAELGADDLIGVDAEARLVRLEREHDNMRAVLRRSLDARDPQSAVRMVSALRNFWRQSSRRNEGMRWMEETLVHSRDADPSLRADVLYSAGELAYFMGGFQAAQEHLEQVVRLRRQLGDQAGLVKALCYQGRSVARTARTPADYDRATALMTEAIVQSGECGARWWAAWAMHLLGSSAWEHAELDVAATHLRNAESILTELGESHALSHVSSTLGSVLRDRGDIEGGRKLLEHTLAESRVKRYCLDSIFEPLYHLAVLARSQGDQPVATQQAVEALLTQKQAGSLAPLADSLELLGGLAGDQGFPDRAATLFAAASTLRHRLSLPIPPILRASYERDLGAARGALGNEQFAVCWAEGLAMREDQVVEYASRTSPAATAA